MKSLDEHLQIEYMLHNKAFSSLTVVLPTDIIRTLSKQTAAFVPKVLNKARQRLVNTSHFNLIIDSISFT